MIDITYCLLCEDFNRRADGGTNIIGAFITPVYVVEMPTIIPRIVVVMSFAIPWEDIDTKVLVTTDLLDMAGRSILPKDQPQAFYLQMSRTQIALPDRTQGAVFPTYLQNVLFQEEGSYVVIVEIDGREAARVPLFLVNFTEDLSSAMLRQMIEHGNQSPHVPEGGRSDA